MGGKIPSDAQIVELYFARDEAAIGHTDRKYGKYLFTVAYTDLKNLSLLLLSDICKARMRQY